MGWTVFDSEVLGVSFQSIMGYWLDLGPTVKLWASFLHLPPIQGYELD